MKAVELMSIPCVGYEVAADWYEGTNDEVVLVLPGFTSKKSKYAKMSELIRKQVGSSILVIDYSGHGDSPFVLEELTGNQNFSEVVRAFDWIRDNYPSSKITVLGTSYGGLHATLLTKYREFDNIILRVPAAYDEKYTYTPIGKIPDPHSTSYRENADNFKDLKHHWMFTGVNAVKNRKLVITHEFDTICPKVSTDAFIEAFQADTWEYPGLQHGFSNSDITEDEETAYYQKMIDWMHK